MVTYSDFSSLFSCLMCNKGKSAHLNGIRQHVERVHKKLMPEPNIHYSDIGHIIKIKFNYCTKRVIQYNVPVK